MRSFIVVLALISLSLSSAKGVDLVENMQLSAGICDNVPDGPSAHVIVTLSDWKPLADSALILMVLNAGRDFALSHCPGVKTISVFVKAKNSDPFEIAATWLHGDQWNVSINRVPYLLGLEESHKAERHRQERSRGLHDP